jgi:hypothetical protein
MHNMLQQGAVTGLEPIATSDSNLADVLSPSE